MEILDYVALSKSRYTGQFSEDKVFNAIVQTLVEYKMKVQKTYKDFAEVILNIDKSTGKNLDLIGSIVGQDRILIDYFTSKYFGFEGNPKAEPFDVGMWYSIFSGKGGESRILTDEEYRRVIKARIIRNRTNCTRRDFIAILDLLMDIDRTYKDRNIFQNSLYNLGTSPSPSENNVAVTQYTKPEYKNLITKVTYAESASSTFPYIGVMSEFNEWNIKVKADKKYTFVCKAASSTGKLDRVALQMHNGFNNVTIPVDIPISKDANNLTQISVVFETYSDSNQADLLMGIQSNNLKDWLVFTDVMIIEGESSKTDWEPSYHSDPSYLLSSTGHGNIQVELLGEAPDLVVYFLSRVDEPDSIIPKPLGYRLQVKVGA